LCRSRKVEFNIEGNPFAAELADYPGFIALVEAACPEQVTLVPDDNDQLTSDHGFNLSISGDYLKPLIQRFQNLGIRVSLFMDPDIEQISLAKAIGANRIEFYTGPYAHAHKQRSKELEPIFEGYRLAAEHAHNIGLELNAGHDLNLDNLSQFLTIPHIAEVSIGHALIVDAIDIGLSSAVTRYSDICHNSHQD
jgi:pyridoxine 5-phosphate synthase